MAAARSSPAESRRDSPDSPCFKAVERRDDTGSEEGDMPTDMVGDTIRK